jgi:hypothetical protein
MLSSADPRLIRLFTRTDPAGAQRVGRVGTVAGHRAASGSADPDGFLDPGEWGRERLGLGWAGRGGGRRLDARLDSTDAPTSVRAGRPGKVGNPTSVRTAGRLPSRRPITIFEGA